MVAGYDNSVDGHYVDLVRFLPDGSLDPDIGWGGPSETRQGAGAAYSVAIQANNMIVVGGAFDPEYYTEYGTMDFGLARFNVNGAVDENFGSSGISRQDLGGYYNSAVTALAIQPDGEILAAGVTGGLTANALTAAAVDRYFAGDVAGAWVRVDSVAQPLPVSGDSTVTADSPYTLTLGDGWTDLGSGTGISYVVNWGDGTSDPPITADDLASQGDQVTHTYAAVTPATGTAVTYQISVNLVDGTTYSGVGGSQSVSVDMTDATTTDLTASPTSASFGGTVTLTATVAAAVSATATPSGNARVGRVLRWHDRPGAGNFRRWQLHAGYPTSDGRHPQFHRGL